jgi:endo-1,4-beta-mannosidase
MAVYLWEEYKPHIIEREMKIISQLGANCIRMFIRWEDLNPIMGKVDESLFSKFDDFIQHAKKYDIKLIPTLLIGHMSGQDWFPQWLLLSEDDKERIDVKNQIIGKPPEGKEECFIRDIYTDKQAVENSKLQLKVLLERYKNNKTILSWDISNENQYWMEPKTPKIGTEYVKNMVKFMKSIDPNHPITYGMGKPDEPSGFISFGKKGFAKYLDYYSVHVYPEWLYPMTANIIDFYISYRIAYECCLAKLTSLPVQLQEFGLSDMFFPLINKETKHKLIYGYFNVALWDVVLNEIKAGALAWDFSDFLPKLKQRNPYDHKQFELYFGAVDDEYNMKPGGLAFQKFSEFIQEFDLSKYHAKKPKVAIILPDKFNKFIIVENERDILEENSLNHSKALFSSFIYTKMCHRNVDFISFNLTDTDLEKYNVLILPNAYNLSKKTVDTILTFLHSGENRIVYISSNNFLPESLFGKLKWINKKKRIRKLELKLNKNFPFSLFKKTLEFKAIRSQIILEKNDNYQDLIPIYKDSDHNSLMFYKPYPNDNRAIFLGISPEKIALLSLGYGL